MLSFLQRTVGNSHEMLGRFSVERTSQKLHVLNQVQICESSQSFGVVGILNRNSQTMTLSAEKTRRKSITNYVKRWIYMQRRLILPLPGQHTGRL